MFDAISRMRSIESIQYLRGIAALMVVAFHVHPQIQRMGYSGSPVDQLAAGVDIFFVISGFIMWLTTRTGGYSTWQFYQHRIVRILPLYWAMTAGIVGVLLVAPRLLQTTTLEWSHVAASFLFVPHPHPVLGGFIPVLNPGWTLNYEMFFYLLFGLTLFAGNVRTRLVLIVGVLVLLSVAPVALPTSGVAAFYTNSIVLEFAAGILVAVVYTRGMIARSWLWLLVIAGGFAWIAVAPDGPRVWRYGVGSLLVVMGTLGIPEFRLRPFRALGDSSYSLYLSHFIVMSAVGQFWRKAGLSGLPIEVFITVSMLVCVAVGWFTYSALELPLTARVRRLFSKPSALHREPHGALEVARRSASVSATPR